MRTILSSVLFYILSLSLTNAQTEYVEGYYINDQGDRIDGFIKNEDWRSNPTSFDFKNDQNADPVELHLSNVSIFESPSLFRFVKATVQIDKSSDNTRFLSESSTPEFQNEEVFLKHLIDGKISLYRYQRSNLVRFFYADKEQSGIAPLIHRKYKDDENQIIENSEYRQTLYLLSKCESLNIKLFEDVKYTEKDLPREAYEVMKTLEKAGYPKEQYIKEYFAIGE